MELADIAPEVAKRDRRLKTEAAALAYKLKTKLLLLEGHSENWEMADVIYRDLEEEES